MIKLVFIGSDGSMGLKHGHKYRVNIYTLNGYIIVDWGKNRCPYSSPQAVAENWKKED